MFQAILFKTHTRARARKRGTKAKVMDEAGNAEVCMSEPNQFHHHGALPPLIRFCEGGYWTTDCSNINRESSQFHTKLTATRPTSRGRISWPWKNDSPWKLYRFTLALLCSGMGGGEISPLHIKFLRDAVWSLLEAGLLPRQQIPDEQML